MFTNCVCHVTLLCGMQPKCPTQAVQHRQGAFMLLQFVMWHAVPGLPRPCSCCFKGFLWPGQVCQLGVVQVRDCCICGSCIRTSLWSTLACTSCVTGQQTVHRWPCSC